MDDHDGGLARDLRRFVATIRRRKALGMLGTASLVPIVACVDDALGMGEGSSSSSGSGESSGAIGDCDPIPGETAGPYPGDGTNGANALALAGIVRSDIRSSLGAASGVADGVPLTIRLVVVDSNGACAPLAGYAVYLWHCDRAGEYSMYTGAATNENYLRGVQEADADGGVEFVSIFPGCYTGRWPHIHFEIYESLAAASNGANSAHVSQLALPEDVCTDAYAASGYEPSVANLGQITLEGDNVFADGVTLQLATVTGNASDGYVATLVVGMP